jgi:8-oxo-dGTP pyrophosphatase MutT (NUDIX family)
MSLTLPRICGVVQGCPPLRIAFDDALRARASAHLTGFERRAAPTDELRAAAVAVVLLPDEAGRACFLITRRAKGLRAHAHQWALPGGRMDRDETPERAALRELSEELGLTLAPEAVLGLLDDYPTPVRLSDHAGGGLGGATNLLVPNPAEVASAHLVPMDELERPRRAPPHLHSRERIVPVIQLPILETLVPCAHRGGGLPEPARS